MGPLGVITIRKKSKAGANQLRPSIFYRQFSPEGAETADLDRSTIGASVAGITDAGGTSSTNRGSFPYIPQLGVRRGVLGIGH